MSRSNGYGKSNRKILPEKPIFYIDMNILLNGKQHELEEIVSVTSLLKLLGANREHVAVELNQCILKRSDFDNIMISDGDHIEVVTFVGGG